MCIFQNSPLCLSPVTKYTSLASYSLIRMFGLWCILSTASTVSTARHLRWLFNRAGLTCFRGCIITTGICKIRKWMGVAKVVVSVQQQIKWMHQSGMLTLSLSWWWWLSLKKRTNICKDSHIPCFHLRLIPQPYLNELYYTLKMCSFIWQKFCDSMFVYTAPSLLSEDEFFASPKSLLEVGYKCSCCDTPKTIEKLKFWTLHPLYCPLNSPWFSLHKRVANSWRHGLLIWMDKLLFRILQECCALEMTLKWLRACFWLLSWIS